MATTDTSRYFDIYTKMNELVINAFIVIHWFYALRDERYIQDFSIMNFS